MPVLSRAQAKLFRREIALRKAGKKGRLASIATAKLAEWVHGAKTKGLPNRVKKRRR